jgi:hypothetical protein
MCDLIKKQDQIFDFAYDVFSGITNTPEETRGNNKKAIRFCLREMGKNKKNRISWGINKSTLSEEKQEEKRRVSRFPSSLILEIDGEKFQAQASGLTKDENIFFCLAILSFIADKSTIYIFNILMTKKVKLPACFSQEYNYLHKLLIKHHFDHFDEIRRLK